MKPEETETVKNLFDFSRSFTGIGVTVKNLVNEYFLVTGTGEYSCNVILNPQGNTAIIEIDEKGENYRIVWGLEQGGGLE